METGRLQCKLLVKFVPLRLIRGQADLRTIHFEQRENQHDDDIIAVGMGARTFLAIEEGGVTSAKKAVLVLLD